MSLFSTLCTGVVQKFVLLETLGDNNKKIKKSVTWGKGEVLKKNVHPLLLMFLLFTMILFCLSFLQFYFKRKMKEKEKQ